MNQEAIESVYLFIAELMGKKICTVDEKLAYGIECYKNGTLPDDQDEDLMETIWLKRLYKELGRWFTYEGLGGDPAEFHWEVPIEIDASASMLAYIGALLGDQRLLEATNCIVKDGQLDDPWKVEGLPRGLVKAAFMPRLYGSAQTAATLWKKGKLDFTREELAVAAAEGRNGMFGTADLFKEFLIRNCNPKEEMRLKVWNDTFSVKCNRWKQVGEMPVQYDLWDSTTKRVRRITHTKTKQVADLEQFRRWMVTGLIHCLDAQVMDTVAGMAYRKYGFCIDIHDAAVVSPVAAADVRRWYANEITKIYQNRETILQNYFKSIGITAASQEAWEAVKASVVPLEDPVFECSVWTLK